MRSGFTITLDKTCYNVTYYTENMHIEPGTLLFNVTIFVEDGVTGIVLIAVPETEIGFAHISGSAHVIAITNSQNTKIITMGIVSGTQIGGEKLTVGQYYASIRLALNAPPFKNYPIFLTIMSKK